MMNEEEFLKKLHNAFALEAEEHFGTIRRGLADLELGRNGNTSEVVELIFREAHSLKGAARAINRGDIESLCQQFESLFSKWKKNPDVVKDAPFELCSDAVDLLEIMLNHPDEMSITLDPLASILEKLKDAGSLNGHVSRESASSSATHPSLPRIDPPNHASTPVPSVDLPLDLPDAAVPDHAVPPEAPAHHLRMELPPVNHQPSTRGMKDTVRVSIHELEDLYRRVEELSTVKFMLGRLTSGLDLVVGQTREWIREYHKHLRLSMEEGRHGGVTAALKQDRLDTLQEFMKWTARQIEGVEFAVSQRIDDVRSTVYTMDTMTEDLVDQTRQLLLLPFSIVTDAFPSMVNKLVRDLGKKVDFRIIGEDVRIDKRILEDLKDPLMHLLRNSIDHGIEAEAVRVMKGKSATGSLRLDIGIAGDGRVQLTLSDDGAGIDIDSVRKRAIEEGIASAEYLAKITDQEILELVFHSGLSTASVVTEVSGRGVGLAVVRENVVSLGGEVTVSTQAGNGTTFRMLLPVSLSNARGVLVRTSGRMYIIPLQYILRGISLPKSDIALLDGKPVFEFEERTVPIYRLEELIGMPVAAAEPTEKDTILVLSYADAMFGVCVEQIMWEQDVVVKSLPSPITRIRTVAGATLLGTGELVPVLHVPDLLDITRTSVSGTMTRAGEDEDVRILRLLVVDDSITSRVLLHDILVSAGYQVKTAIDGIDALTHLRESMYDLVVSDVEMPRMNGFELTQTIRGDEKLHELPVILVTGLESREDRERGFDVGANAYIIKSGFDQSNLLEVIGRLV